MWTLQGQWNGPADLHCHPGALAAGLICVFFLLHLAIPGRTPGSIYHWQGHMSCQPSRACK